jgi:hypothetical protein
MRVGESKVIDVHTQDLVSYLLPLVTMTTFILVSNISQQALQSGYARGWDVVLLYLEGLQGSEMGAFQG